MAPYRSGGEAATRVPPIDRYRHPWLEPKGRATMIALVATSGGPLLVPLRGENWLAYAARMSTLTPYVLAAAISGGVAVVAIAMLLYRGPRLTAWRRHRAEAAANEALRRMDETIKSARRRRCRP